MNGYRDSYNERRERITAKGGRRYDRGAKLTAVTHSEGFALLGAESFRLHEQLARAVTVGGRPEPL
ncbi:MAG: hypothetical protein IAI50_14800 [Candidatus Eremiobacteraeota bacterium]|nr:hypothetical protein [Candidatus Eremiobacteraeota bacterium]